jgi:dienelactone hydrolase
MKMRKLTILLFFVIASFGAQAQNVLAYINMANKFFDDLDSGKYVAAQAYFDDTVKEKLPPETLEKIWQQITSKLGKLESVNGAQNKVQGEYQIVILNCKFTNDEQPFQFVFNKTNKLVGFNILPKATTDNYKIPVYADPAIYVEKLITIKSGKYDLPAMVTLPRDSMNCPVVVLIHGSGPADMDETVGAHKPFKDLALGLASKGIASVRYVKRTALYPAAFEGAYTTNEEVLEDARNVIAFAKNLPQIDSQKVYLFGHSLGGMLAPKIALDQNIKGVILAAAPARKFQDISIDQNNYFFNIAKDTTKAGKIALTGAIAALNKTKTITDKNIAQDSVMLGLPASYWADLNAYDQLATAKKLNNRIFVIQGGNDFQVTDKDYNLWLAALKGKKGFDAKIYPMLNHLFSFVSEKGTPSQYTQQGSVDQPVVDDLSAWILQK